MAPRDLFSQGLQHYSPNKSRRWFWIRKRKKQKQYRVENNNGKEKKIKEGKKEMVVDKYYKEHKKY